MKLEFHPGAALELREAASRYEVAVSCLGEQFGAEVERGVTALLLKYPGIGRDVGGGRRKFSLQGDFPSPCFTHRMMMFFEFSQSDMIGAGQAIGGPEHDRCPAVR